MSSTRCSRRADYLIKSRTARSSTSNLVVAVSQTTFASKLKYPCARMSRIPRILRHSTTGALARTSSGSFADHLEVANDSVVGSLVGNEGVEGHVRNESPDLRARLDNVVGEEPPIPRAR